MVKKIVTGALGCLVFGLCMCGSSPLSSSADGSLEEPTMPMSIALDSKGHLMDTTIVVSVIEIYDLEKKLVNFGESTTPLSVWGMAGSDVTANIYWNGLDKSSNPVESGKYTVKISIFTSDTSYCQYTSIFIKKVSTPVGSEVVGG